MVWWAGRGCLFPSFAVPTKRNRESLFYRSGVKMDCPLPIDWLDYLEGRESESDLGAHLADCGRCQALVAQLREQSVGVELAPYSGRALENAPRWQEQDRLQAAVGDVWLTKAELVNSYA